MCKKLCFIATIESTLESFVIPAAYVFKEKGYDVSLLCSMSDHFVEKYSKDFRLINVKMNRGISIRDVLIKPYSNAKILITCSMPQPMLHFMLVFLLNY